MAVLHALNYREIHLEAQERVRSYLPIQDLLDASLLAQTKREIDWQIKLVRFEELL